VRVVVESLGRASARRSQQSIPTAALAKHCLHELFVDRRGFATITVVGGLGSGLLVRRSGLLLLLAAGFLFVAAAFLFKRPRSASASTALTGLSSASSSKRLTGFGARAERRSAMALGLYSIFWWKSQSILVITLTRRARARQTTTTTHSTPRVTRNDGILARFPHFCCSLVGWMVRCQDTRRDTERTTARAPRTGPGRVVGRLLLAHLGDRVHGADEGTCVCYETVGGEYGTPSLTPLTHSQTTQPLVNPVLPS